MKTLVILLSCTIVQADDFSDLNARSYETRNRAANKLFREADNRLEEIVLHSKENKSLEVRKRCECILRDYYKPCNDNLPSIWSLPAQVRFEFDIDASFHFYQIAHNDDRPFTGWIYGEYDNPAMSMFLNNYIRRYGRKATIELKNRVFELEYQLLEEDCATAECIDFYTGIFIPQVIEFRIK